MTAVTFALKHWRSILSGLGFLILGIMLLSARADSRHWHKESDRYAGLYHAEQVAHKATVANYLAAAELARAQDQANKARVERDQAVISQEVSHDYQERLAALRARYDALRVRGQRSEAAADPGASGDAAMPEAGPAPGGPDGTAALDPFACEANTLQLDALQTWVRQQAAVPVG